MRTNNQVNFALWFACARGACDPEKVRMAHLPEFNPGWLDALRLARKEWLLDQVKEIEKLEPNEQQAALLKLSDIDLELIGMKRTKLEAPRF